MSQHKSWQIGSLACVIVKFKETVESFRIFIRALFLNEKRSPRSRMIFKLNTAKNRSISYIVFWQTSEKHDVKLNLFYFRCLRSLSSLPFLLVALFELPPNERNGRGVISRPWGAIPSDSLLVIALTQSPPGTDFAFLFRLGLLFSSFPIFFTIPVAIHKMDLALINWKRSRQQRLS